LAVTNSRIRGGRTSNHARRSSGVEWSSFRKTALGLAVSEGTDGTPGDEAGDADAVVSPWRGARMLEDAVKAKPSM